MPRSHAVNAVELTLTEETGGASTTFTFDSTSAAPAVPCYAVVDLADDTKREYVLFTAKTATTLQTADLDGRYLEGSAAASDLTHEVGGKVLFAPTAQNLADLWDAVEANETALDGTASDPHANAQHSTDLVGEAGVIAALTEKVSPHDDDVLVLEDSEDSNNPKKVKTSALGSGATSAFRGALVILDANQSVADSGEHAIAWDSVVYDTDSIFDLVADATVATTPADATRVRVSAGALWASSATGERRMDFTRGGSGGHSGAGGSRIGAHGNVRHGAVSAVLVDSGGTAFKVTVRQTSGGALNLVGTVGQTWMMVEILA